MAINLLASIRKFSAISIAGWYLNGGKGIPSVMITATFLAVDLSPGPLKHWSLMV